MKKYISLYAKLLQFNFSVLLSYRANLVNSLISSFLWGGMSFVSILLLTSRSNSIYGWTQGELIMITAGYNIIVGVFHMLFSPNFERFVVVINRGDLDGILAKPADSQFMLTFWYITYTTLIRITFGIVAMALLIHILHIHVTVFSIILFSCLSILGIAILYSIWFMVSTLLIWYPQITNVLGFLYELNGFARFPGDAYQFFNVFVFAFFLPITFVVTTPVKSLLSKMQWNDLLGILFFSIFLVILSRFFWKFALKHYSSASS